MYIEMKHEGQGFRRLGITSKQVPSSIGTNQAKSDLARRRVDARNYARG